MRRADVTASGLRGAGAIDEVKNAITRCGQQQVSEFLTPATRAASLKQPLSDQTKEEARTLVKGKGREKLTRLLFLRGPMRTNTPKVKKVTPAQATGGKTYSFFSSRTHAHTYAKGWARKDPFSVCIGRLLPRGVSRGASGVAGAKMRFLGATHASSS